MALELLKKEILFQTDLERLIGKRPFDQRTTYEEFMDTENSDASEAVIIDEVKNVETTELEKEPSLTEEHPPKV